MLGSDLFSSCSICCGLFISIIFTTGPDFLKANSFAQSKCSEWFFLQKHVFKMTLENIKKTRKTLSNCDKYMKLVPVFPVSGSLVQKFAQILKYFAQSCDCMIAAFRISARTQLTFLLSKIFYASHITSIPSHLVYKALSATGSTLSAITYQHQGWNRGVTGLWYGKEPISGGEERSRSRSWLDLWWSFLLYMRDGCQLELHISTNKEQIGFLRGATASKEERAALKKKNGLGIGKI